MPNKNTNILVKDRATRGIGIGDSYMRRFLSKNTKIADPRVVIYNVFSCLSS